MIATFSQNKVSISSTGEVFKSEDGETYFYIGSGNFVDSNICLPASWENPNYYFYSGENQILSVACKSI